MLINNLIIVDFMFYCKSFIVDVYSRVIKVLLSVQKRSSTCPFNRGLISKQHFHRVFIFKYSTVTINHEVCIQGNVVKSFRNCKIMKVTKIHSSTTCWALSIAKEIWFSATMEIP